MKLYLPNKILKNDTYRLLYEHLQNFEKDRIFCHHNMEHFLSVARITMLSCSEKNIAADPEIIYSAALLHDIGRAEEYSSGTPHDEAGITAAEKILDETGCENTAKEKILSLIKYHRQKDNFPESVEAVFYEADKKSRNCFMCPAFEKCNWDKSKKNLYIEV